MQAAQIETLDDHAIDAVTRSRLAIRDEILDLLGDDVERQTCVEGLTIIQRVVPVPPTSFVYQPSLAMIMQGRKNIELAGQSLFYDEAHFMLTAVDLPTITEVTQASSERPYVSVLLELDLEMAKDVMTRIDTNGRATPPTSGLSIGGVDLSMMSAMERLVSLARTPEDASFLAEPIKQELLYRLLTHPVGSQLREIVNAFSQSHRVAKAISWLRGNFRQSLNVGDLADMCALGVSTLHLHFRAMTGTSPLQYQKRLRLHEARRLLVNGDSDVGMAAYAVGYESATQFNREYKRLFGAPPRRETQAVLSNAKDAVTPS